MTDPKPSTNDILSKIRAKAAAAPSSDIAASPGETPPVAEVPVAETPAAEVVAQSAVAPAVAPKGTADILAAARAKAAAKPAATPGGGAAAAAPKSPADIMAAIRAKAGATPAASAPPVAAAEKPAAAKVDPSIAVGLSAAEMIKAARSGVVVTTPSAPKVVLPSRPLPGKVSPVASKAAAVTPDRRSVLEGIALLVCSPIVIAWTSFSATMVASALATARFMMPNVLVEPPTRFKIGPPNDYAPGTVSTKWQAQFNIWVVNGEIEGTQMIYALSTVCTHLGCTPNWLEGEQKFKCPCHGSGFYKTGVNFEGPAPRPLERVGLRLAEDGMLEVDKSVKFQRELGQWTNAASFVGVT